MSKPDYTALDAAILAAIKEKQPAMFHVFAYDGDVKAKSLALAHTEKNGDAWRVADRRLQTLRKAGQVHYQRKPEGWVIATPQQAVAMSDPIDIVARLSGMSADHGPDGWPAVQMRDITALCEEVTRLRAALAQAGAGREPVTWQYRDANDDGTCGAWTGCDKQPQESTWRQVRPLYAHPSPAQREPLSDAQIDSAPVLTLADHSALCGLRELRQFARQIEAACVAAWGVQLNGIGTTSGTKGAA